MNRPAHTIMLWLCATAVAFGADWPRFRGPNGDGISPETGINKNWSQKPPKVLWTLKMSDNGYAGPAVAGGRMFIMDHQGQSDVLRAIDMATGSQVWEALCPDPEKDNYGFARCTPTIDDGKVYTLTRIGVVSCHDAKDGKPIWSRDIKKDFDGQQDRKSDV